MCCAAHKNETSAVFNRQQQRKTAHICLSLTLASREFRLKALRFTDGLSYIPRWATQSTEFFFHCFFLFLCVHLLCAQYRSPHCYCERRYQHCECCDRIVNIREVWRDKEEMDVVTHFHFEHQIRPTTICIHIKWSLPHRPRAWRIMRLFQLEIIDTYQIDDHLSSVNCSFLESMAHDLPALSQSVSRSGHMHNAITVQAHFLFGLVRQTHPIKWRTDKRFSIVWEFNGFLSLFELLSFVKKKSLIFVWIVEIYRRMEWKMEWDDENRYTRTIFQRRI